MNNIKSTDVVTAVRQALTENQGIGTYHIDINVIVSRILVLLEQQDKDQVLLG